MATVYCLACIGSVFYIAVYTPGVICFTQVQVRHVRMGTLIASFNCDLCPLVLFSIDEYLFPRKFLDWPTVLLAVGLCVGLELVLTTHSIGF